LRLRFAAVLFIEPFAAAHAAPFKVYSPTVEYGVTEVEAYGYRDLDHRSGVDGSEKHKVTIGHGFTDYWFSEIGGEWEKEGRESRKLEAFEWENRFQFAPQGKYWLDTGLLVEYERARDRDDADEITVAPLLEKEIGGHSVATLNLRFSRHIGSNAESGTEFSYAARWKYNLHPLYEPAIEFFGEPGRIGHLPSTQQQPHWLGPAVYGKAKLGAGRAFVYSAALLFGYTDAASDKRLVLRAEYEF
jgi:hypothetical protein